MKKLLSIGMIILVAFTFSCGGSSDDPKAVAEDFLKAVAEQDYTKAKELGTETTGQLLSMIEGMASMIPEDQVKADKEDIKSLKMGDVEINGDNAVVYFSTNKKDGDKIDLKKVDGKWKVDMKKEQP
ncbi:MAG: DUF4878 domain-containing protein [Chlorobi bacterium]|nr:DUF4878 domain-containing protein [Chlorobiota bacterium]